MNFAEDDIGTVNVTEAKVFSMNVLGSVTVTTLKNLPVGDIGPVDVDQQTSLVECLEAASAPRRISVLLFTGITPWAHENWDGSDGETKLNISNLNMPKCASR